MNSSSVLFFVSFVVQILCDSQNEYSSAAVEVGHREQDIFCRPTAVKEKLNVELPIHRSQAQGNDIVLLFWLNQNTDLKYFRLTIMPLVVQVLINVPKYLLEISSIF